MQLLNGTAMLFPSEAEEGALEEAIRSDLVTLDGRLSLSWTDLSASLIPAAALLRWAPPLLSIESGVSSFLRQCSF